jgi:hypothetical protein
MNRAERAQIDMALAYLGKGTPDGAKLATTILQRLINVGPRPVEVRAPGDISRATKLRVLRALVDQGVAFSVGKPTIIWIEAAFPSIRFQTDHVRDEGKAIYPLHGSTESDVAQFKAKLEEVEKR